MSTRAEERKLKKSECDRLARKAIEYGGGADVITSQGDGFKDGFEVPGAIVENVPLIGRPIKALLDIFGSATKAGTSFGAGVLKNWKMDNELKMQDMDCSDIPFDEIREKLDEGFKNQVNPLKRSLNGLENNSVRLNKRMVASDATQIDRNSGQIETTLGAVERDYSNLENNIDELKTSHGAIEVREEEANLQGIKQNYGAVKENYAAIKDVSGQVGRNLNAIEHNFDQLKINEGEIKMVGGKVDRNFGAMQHVSSQVDRNLGAIEKNFDQLKVNQGEIRVVGGKVDRNFGAIQHVSSQVDRNLGAIEKNFDQLKINQGEIRVVGGKVDRNFGAIQHVSSQVDRNLGAIERNFDQLKINQGEIRVVGGKVDRNFGAIQHVSSQVDRNLGAIERNFDQLKVNQGEIRVVGGKVDRNFGAIQQVSAQVDRNLGAIDRNFNQLKLIEGDVKVVDGKVDRNYGAMLHVSGQVEKNLEAIERNFDQLKINEGEIKLVGGKVDRNFGAIQQVSAQVDRNLEAIDRNFSQLKVNEGEIKLVGGKVDRNFGAIQQVSAQVDRNLEAIDRNFSQLKVNEGEIKLVGGKVDRNFGAIQQVSAQVDRNLEAIDRNFSQLKINEGKIEIVGGKIDRNLGAIKQVSAQVDRNLEAIERNFNQLKVNEGEIKIVGGKVDRNFGAIKQVSAQVERNLEAIERNFNQLKINEGEIKIVGGKVDRNFGAITKVSALVETNFVAIKENLKQIIANSQAIRQNYEEIRLVSQKVDRNYGTLLENYNVTKQNLEATFQNYLAINQVGDKVDRNLSVMLSGFKYIVHKLDEAKDSINNRIQQLQVALETDKLRQVVTQIKIFFDRFSIELDGALNLSHDQVIEKLEAKDGTLEFLKSVKNPTRDNLHSDLKNIISRNLAIPKDSDDAMAFIILDLLYSGAELYTSVLYSLVRSYVYLAAHYFRKNDVEKYNDYLSELQITANGFVDLLNGVSRNVGLLHEVKGVFDQVKELRFVKEEAGELVEVLLKRSKSIDQIRSNLRELIRRLPEEAPAYKIKFDFSKSNISTPIGKWKDGVEVSYAIHIGKPGGLMTKVGQWVTYQIQDRAHPQLGIGKAPAGRKRSIFRKFEGSKPELVGIVEDSKQSEFRDISYDLYTAVSNRNEKSALRDVEILLKNGADINVEYKDQGFILNAAAAEGNLEVVSVLIQNRADLEAGDINDNTPLHIAAKHGYKSIVELLIKSGADVNAKNDVNSTPLHNAASSGNKEIFSLLIEKGASPNSTTLEGFTPLHTASAAGEAAIVDLLASRNDIDMNPTSEDGLTPLHLASSAGNEDVARTLLANNKIDINAKTRDGITPLHLASTSGSLAIVKLLAAQNEISRTKRHVNMQRTRLKVNEQSTDGLSPLHLATFFEKENVATELLKMNEIEVNLKNKDGWTPLHVAAMKDEAEVIVGLHNKNALPERQDRLDHTPLHFAAEQGNLVAVETLVKTAKAALNVRRTDGRTPLQLAVIKNKRDVMQFLIKEGARINTRDRTGTSTLDYAIQSANQDLVKELVELLEKYNHGFKGALHSAAHYGSLDILKPLVDAKVDGLNSRDKSGNTPIQLAAVKGNFDIVTYLSDQGAELESKDNENNSLLHFAALSGDSRILQFLVGKGASVNSTNNYNSTPLHLASFSGQSGAVKYLIHGDSANINSQDDGGNTALHLLAASTRADFSIKTLEQMKQSGANLDLINKKGYTPLLKFAQTGKWSAVRYLVGAGADKKVTTPLGESVLHFAARDGSETMIEVLTEANPELTNLRDKNGWSPVFWAARKGHLSVVKTLIDKKQANRDATDERGRSLLHVAVLSGNQDLVKYLVEDKKFNTNAADKESSTALHLAAREGHLNIVELLMNNEASKDATPLLEAAGGKNWAVVKYLIKRGANTDGADKDGNTLAHKYANGGALTLMKSLKGNLNLKNARGETPLHLAVANNHRDVVEYLVGERGVTVQDKDKDKNTALHRAALFGDLDVVKYLTERGANPSAMNGSGKTACDLCRKLSIARYFIDEKGVRYDSEAFKAVENDELGILKYLIEVKSVDADRPDKDGKTLLHHTAKRGAVDTVKYLVGDRRVDIHKKDKSANDPFFYALQSGHFYVADYLDGMDDQRVPDYGANLFDLAKEGNVKALEYLLDKLTDVDMKDNNGKTPLERAFDAKDDDGNSLLHHAVKLDSLSLVKHLVELGASINVKNNAGKTPLQSARGRATITKYMVEKEGITKEVNENNETPLIRAAQSGRLELVSYLVEQEHADMNAKSKTGSTALHAAVQEGHLDTVKYLVEKGADINAKDNEDLSALNHAAHQGNLDIVKYLADKGADTNAMDGRNESPLHKTASKGYLDIMKYLVKKGADVKATDASNRTPLDVAIEHEHLEVIKYLIDELGIKYEGDILTASEKGQLVMVRYFLEEKYNSVSTRDNAGWTPLIKAAYFGHLNLVKYLVEEKQADINEKNNNGFGSVHAAAEKGYLDIIKYFIGKGAYTHVMDNSNRTPRDYALEFNHPVISDTLQYRRKRRSYDAEAETLVLRLAHNPRASSRTSANAIGFDDVSSQPETTRIVTENPDVIGTLLAFSLLNKLPIIGRFFPAVKSTGVNRIEKPRVLTVAESVINATEITEKFEKMLNRAAAQLNISDDTLNLDLYAVSSKIAQKLRHNDRPSELTKLLVSSVEKYPVKEEKLLALIGDKLSDLEEVYKWRLDEVAMRQNATSLLTNNTSEQGFTQVGRERYNNTANLLKLDRPNLKSPLLR